MIENTGIIKHHAVYAIVTVVVPCTDEVFETTYGPQPERSDEDTDDGHEMHFEVSMLRVPCARERLVVHVLPGDHATKSLHAGSYLSIVGRVDHVEHQVYSRGASGHSLGTTFVYLDLHLMQVTFPKDWVPLK